MLNCKFLIYLQEFIKNLFDAKITVRTATSRFTELYNKGEIEKELQELGKLFKKRNHVKLTKQIDSMFKLAQIKGSAQAMKNVAKILEAKKIDLSPGEFVVTLILFYKQRRKKQPIDIFENFQSVA